MLKRVMLFCAVILLVCFSQAVRAQWAPEISSVSNRITSESLMVRFYPKWTLNTCKASPDDRRLACVVYKYKMNGSVYINGKMAAGDTLFVIVDGKRGKLYGDIVSSLTFSQDSKHLAYFARALNDQKNKWFVVLDSVEGKWYDAVEEQSLTFSPDCQRLAYVACLNQKWFVVLNGKRGKPYDEIIAIRGKMITFDSTCSFHYLGRKGNAIYLVEENIE